MPTTPNRSYPYPVLDNSPNAPLDIQRLAEAMDADIADVDARATFARDEVDAARTGQGPGTLVRRSSSSGTVAMPDPQTDEHVATKGYTDRAISASASRLQERQFAFDASAGNVPAGLSSLTVTIPSGRFNGPPVVAATALNSDGYNVGVSLGRTSATSVTFRIQNRESFTVGVRVHGIATPAG